MVTAINIETEVRNKVVKLLVSDHWDISLRYDNMDVGIDFDFLILEREGQEILFGWYNWFEGEIQCSEQRMSQIEQQENRLTITLLREHNEE